MKRTNRTRPLSGTVQNCTCMGTQRDRMVGRPGTRSGNRRTIPADGRPHPIAGSPRTKRAATRADPDPASRIADRLPNFRRIMFPPRVPARVPNSIPLAAVPFLAVLLCAACGAGTWHGTVLEPPLEVPTMAGVDHRGDPFDSGSLEGRLQVVFFGYTFCPDICPATLHEVADALSAQSEAVQQQVEVLFVTVDPQRDGPGRLKAYVGQFHPSVKGIRLEDPEALAALTAGYGVYVASGAESAGDDVYLVDHTARVYVLNREGRMALTYTSDLKAEDLAADLKRLAKQR